jgi:hypothetical protein
MHRPAKGATRRPPMERPGMGFGRPLRPDARRIPRADLEAEYAALIRGDDVVETEIVVLDGRSSVTGSDRRS